MIVTLNQMSVAITFSLNIYILEKKSKDYKTLTEATTSTSASVKDW